MNDIRVAPPNFRGNPPASSGDVPQRRGDAGMPMISKRLPCDGLRRETPARTRIVSAPPARGLLEGQQCDLAALSRQADEVGNYLRRPERIENPIVRHVEDPQRPPATSRAYGDGIEPRPQAASSTSVK